MRLRSIIPQYVVLNSHFQQIGYILQTSASILIVKSRLRGMAIAHDAWISYNGQKKARANFD
jgi:hypothetical protein